MRAQAKPVTSRRTLGDFPFLHAVRFTSDGVLHMGKGFPPKLPWILVCSTCERRPVSVVGHNDGAPGCRVEGRGWRVEGGGTSTFPCPSLAPPLAFATLAFARSASSSWMRLGACTPPSVPTPRTRGGGRCPVSLAVVCGDEMDLERGTFNPRFFTLDNIPETLNPNP